jgi:NAD(P)-dependent dehydrogenase (short-subunit alcohol dehydrogenase family)
MSAGDPGGRPSGRAIDPSPETAPISHSLDDRTVVVVGGGHHMGLAVARAAAAARARVVIVGRDATRLESAAGLLRDDGAAEVVTEATDVSDERKAEELLGRQRGFDHLVITISTGASTTTIGETEVAAARAPFDNRFWPTYGLLHLAPRFMSEEGSITLTSGSSGVRPQVGLGVYGTMHAALNGLARAAAIELAPLRVNAISPGGIGIGRTRQLIPHPGEARDFGAMAVGLMLNPAVTGIVVDVDGGEFLGEISDR